MNKLSKTQLSKVLETQVAKERVQYLWGIANSFYPETIEDVFVSEYRDSEGKQIIESVWFFTKNYMCEFKDPLRDERFDLAVLANSLNYLESSKKDFDFKNTTESSRFTVDFTTTHGIHGNLKATGVNCLQLLRIVRDRLFPNILSSRSTRASFARRGTIRAVSPTAEVRGSFLKT